MEVQGLLNKGALVRAKLGLGFTLLFVFINVEVMPQTEKQTGLPNANDCLGGVVSDCGLR